MEILILFFCLIFIDYTLFIGLLIYGSSKVKPFDSRTKTVQTSFSIVVPFRNEASNLPDILASFVALDYPKELFDIIFVDDASEDDSVRLINTWRMEHTAFHVTILDNVRTTNAPKKDAITRAVSISKKDWIVTTDADCRVPSQWLLTLDNCIQLQNPGMIVGAVNLRKDPGFLSHFQQMDMLSLQGATLGSFGLNEAFMCNGANLAYDRCLFSELDGFKGNTNIASGDDVFLLQKAIAQNPKRVFYLKTKAAIVETKPLKSWKAVFLQHIRWASKSGAYQSDFSKGLAVMVFLANCSLLALLALAITEQIHWSVLLVATILKFIIDWILMWQTNRLLNLKMTSILISSIVYPFFSVLVALFSLRGAYTWKGRRFTPFSK